MSGHVLNKELLNISIGDYDSFIYKEKDRLESVKLFMSDSRINNLKGLARRPLGMKNLPNSRLMYTVGCEDLDISKFDMYDGKKYHIYEVDTSDAKIYSVDSFYTLFQHIVKIKLNKNKDNPSNIDLDGSKIIDWDAFAKEYDVFEAGNVKEVNALEENKENLPYVGALSNWYKSWPKKHNVVLNTGSIKLRLLYVITNGMFFRVGLEKKLVESIMRPELILNNNKDVFFVPIHQKPMFDIFKCINKNYNVNLSRDNSLVINDILYFNLEDDRDSIHLDCKDIVLDAKKIKATITNFSSHKI